MMSREEHLAWAKHRALELVEEGQPDEGYCSLITDLRVHPELAEHPGIEMGLSLMKAGFLVEHEQVRLWIGGFK